MGDNAQGLIFAKGHLEASASDGSNVVRFAELQDVSIEARDSTKKLYGPDSIFALASEISEREVTIRAQFAKVRAVGLKKLWGGELSYAEETGTTLAISSASLPETFQAVLKSPTDGSDITLKFYKVRAMNPTLPMASKDWVLPSFEMEVMVVTDGGANDGKVCDFILPGMQTST